MTALHELTTEPIGLLRIYMKPSDRVPSKARRSLFGGKPLHRELIRLAKADGLTNAIAHHTTFGFSNQGPIADDGYELANPHLTLCVELVGTKEALEAFCRRHGTLLEDRVIVYKSVEQWRLRSK